MGYWEFYEDWLVHILDYVRNLEDLPIKLPNNANYYLITLSLASCSSDELTPVSVHAYQVIGDNGLPETEYKTYYGYKKCSDDVYCESQYSVTWFYNPQTQMLDLDARFVRRDVDVFGDCPDEHTYYLHHVHPAVRYDIRCTTKCEE